MRQWYHPKIDYGWKPIQSPGTRQRHLMECADPSLSLAERFLEAAEAVQKLAEFGETEDIRKKAQEDAYVLFRKAKAANAEPKPVSEPKNPLSLFSGWNKDQSDTARRQGLVSHTDIKLSWQERYRQAAQKALKIAEDSDDPVTQLKANTDGYTLLRKARALEGG